MSLKSLVLCCSLLTVSQVFSEAKYKEGQLIVRLKSSTPTKFMANFATAKKTLSRSLNLHLVKVKSTLAYTALIEKLRNNKNVLYVQRDHYVTARYYDRAPNDDLFNEQWGLNNDFNNGSDIKAVQAWELAGVKSLSNADQPVIAIVDGGVDYRHEDLKENMWVNTNEIPGNGVDDDGNGYVDDIYGWNAGTKSGTITAGKHGTHVGGIAGARGDNKIGVSGVSPRAKIMSVIYSGGSGGLTSKVLAAYGYILDQKKLWLESKGKKGANIVATNSSFGVDRAKCDSGEYAAWNDIYDRMGSVGILSVAATANQNWNIDQTGDVPTGCGSDFLLSVTNSTNKAQRNSYAGFGKTTIDLAAPGTKIVATLPDNDYGELTGTSMATPHVTGAIGFLSSIGHSGIQTAVRKEPAKFALYMKKVLMQTVSPSDDLKGKTVSGGILNLEKAAQKILSDFSK